MNRFATPWREVTPGPRGDTTQAEKLFAGFEPEEVGYVVADVAFESDAIRGQVKRLGAKVCIRPNPTRTVRKRDDRKRYRHCNRIEQFFCKLKRYRRVAMRYEKKAANFVGIVWLAAFVMNN